MNYKISEEKMEAMIWIATIVSMIWIAALLKWLTTTTRKENAKAVKKRNVAVAPIPSPKGIPFFGNLLQLGALPHHSIHSLAKQHGPIMLLRFGKVPTVVISSAQGAKEIMKTNDLLFADRPRSRIRERLLYNMKDISVAPYGEYWRHLKSIGVIQLMSNKKVDEFRPIREEETALMVKNIQDSVLMNSNSTVNLSELLVAFTNDVVSRAALGKKHGQGPEGKKIRMLFSEFIQLLGARDYGAFVPWLGWINRFNGLDARIDRVVQEVDQFLEKVIEERLMMTNGQLFGESENGEDFLNILLRIYKDDTESGFSLERNSLKAIILDVFSAGTDTTSLVPEWVMTELLRHPNVLKALQNEVRGVLQGKHVVSDSDIEKMKYLKAVLKETLRLHPPFPMLIPREAREDTKVMGYDIAAGTMVLINAWTIGRDPLVWDEPEEFKPERFLNSSIDYKGHDFNLIPFGAGRRGCPGISLAMATIEFALVTLLNKFDWSLPTGAKETNLDIDERPGASIRRKNPLIVVAIPTST